MLLGVIFGFSPNAQSPIVTFSFCIVIEVNWLLLNALFPIDVTLFGIVTDVNWFPTNASFPIVTTFAGITKFDKDHDRKIDEVIRRADKLMYDDKRIKKEKRNN